MSYKKLLAGLVLGFMLIPILAVPIMAMSYTVVPGDSLFKIGQKFGVNHQSIMQENGLKNSVIRPGMNLSIPQKPAAGNSYTVKAGDTLYILAKRFGTTVNQIKSYNGLKSDTVIIGQKLIIPGATAATVTSARGSRNNFTQEEINLMAQAVYGEARGESYTGQVAIAAVILNRLESPDFPDTIKGVIFQPWAFTAVHDGQFWLTPNATAVKAVRDAINGHDPTGGALYYWNPETATNKWVWTRSIIKTIGKHVFAK